MMVEIGATVGRRLDEVTNSPPSSGRWHGPEPGKTRRSGGSELRRRSLRQKHLPSRSYHSARLSVGQPRYYWADYPLIVQLLMLDELLRVMIDRLVRFAEFLRAMQEQVKPGRFASTPVLGVKLTPHVGGHKIFIS